jgi:hypothetical protein
MYTHKEMYKALLVKVLVLHSFLTEQSSTNFADITRQLTPCHVLISTEVKAITI